MMFIKIILLVIVLMPLNTAWAKIMEIEVKDKTPAQSSPAVDISEEQMEEKLAQQQSDAKKDAEPPPSAVDYNTVVLQGLNKVTGHVSKLEGPVGTVLRFGTLEIISSRCWKASPEERPENAALLEIRELKAGEAPQRIFLGWMFSSSPGLSGLEHPVYDVNVLSCEARNDPESKAQESKASQNNPDHPPSDKTESDKKAAIKKLTKKIYDKKLGN